VTNVLIVIALTLFLADGIPGRVGLLRGAGNAIVPWLAAEFIAAWADCRDNEKEDQN